MRCRRRKFVDEAPGPIVATARAAGSVLAPVCNSLATASERCDGAALLRIANLDPFHVPHRLPASSGGRVPPPDASEPIAALEIASHPGASASVAEHLSIDGGTWRPSLAVRCGFAKGWESCFGLSAVSHGAGLFGGLIETSHSVFGPPRGGRDAASRDRRAIALVRPTRGRVISPAASTSTCPASISREPSAPEDRRPDRGAFAMRANPHPARRAARRGLGRAGTGQARIAAGMAGLRTTLRSVGPPSTGDGART